MKIHIKPHSPGIKDTACKDTKGIFLNDNNTGIKNKKRILVAMARKHIGISISLDFRHHVNTVIALVRPKDVMVYARGINHE